MPNNKSQMPPLKRSRRLNSKRLPPLDDIENGEHSGYRINSFYQAPIGDENISVKYMQLKQAPEKRKGTVEPQERVIQQRPPSFDLKAKTLNPRFVRKVLHNHDRTQKKSDYFSSKADQECNKTQQIMDGTNEQIAVWKRAQDHFQQTVIEKFEVEVFNSPSRHQQSSGRKDFTFKFASTELARKRMQKQVTIDLAATETSFGDQEPSKRQGQQLPLYRKPTLKR